MINTWHWVDQVRNTCLISGDILTAGKRIISLSFPVSFFFSANIFPCVFQYGSWEVQLQFIFFSDWKPAFPLWELVNVCFEFGSCRNVTRIYLGQIWLCDLFSFSSVQFSHSVMSNSLRPHESQHARPPCPSPIPRAHSNSSPSSLWCHPAISSSVVPFSSCPQSLAASGSFPMSQIFTWGGQSIGVSASTSVLPINTQDWSPLGWTAWISLQSKGLSRVFSNTTGQKHQFFGAQLSSQSNSYIHTWPLEKP